MVSISTTLSGEISHVRLFLMVSCGTLGRCLGPLGSAEPRLKITGLWLQQQQQLVVVAVLSLSLDSPLLWFA